MACPSKSSYSQIDEPAASDSDQAVPCDQSTLLMEVEVDSTGSVADNEVVPRRREAATTFVLVAMWYASSCVCNETSKALLLHTRMNAQTLTLMQLVISSACGAVYMFVLRLTPVPYQKVVGSAWGETLLLAAAFTTGFATLNASFAVMHNSLVMVLRAAEPITTLILAHAMLCAA